MDLILIFNSKTFSFDLIFLFSTQTDHALVTYTSAHGSMTTIYQYTWVKPNPFSLGQLLTSARSITSVTTCVGCILEADLSSEKKTSKVIKNNNIYIYIFFKGEQRTRCLQCIAPHHTTKALKTKLQTARNKMIRLLLNLPSQAHLTANQLLSVEWLTIANRVQHLAMGLVHKIHH